MNKIYDRGAWLGAGCALVVFFGTLAHAQYSIDRPTIDGGGGTTGRCPPANWTNSRSGSANPIVVPAGSPTRFYRLFKP